MSAAVDTRDVVRSGNLHGIELGRVIIDVAAGWAYPTERMIAHHDSALRTVRLSKGVEGIHGPQLTQTGAS